MTKSGVASSGLEFTKKSANRYAVTHSSDRLPIFTIKKEADNKWHAYTPDGSLILPPELNRNVLFQKVRQFYDDRKDMNGRGTHPNFGKADEIAKHLFKVFRADGKEAIQKEFQRIVDQDKPMRWEIVVIKDKFLALVNPPVTEAKVKTLKKNKKTLTPDEQDKVNAADLESTIWKSVDPKTGDIIYVASTHRAADTAPTLKGAISKAKNFIDSTS